VVIDRSGHLAAAAAGASFSPNIGDGSHDFDMNRDR